MNMSNKIDIRNVNDYNRFVGAAAGHPLVSVIPYDEVSPIPHGLCRFAVYGLFLRDDHEEALNYGMCRYDYREGSLICVAPGQTGGVEADGKRFHAKGYALLFSPALIAGTPLETHIGSYSFFAYSQNEALHMSPEERAIYITLLGQLRSETQKQADEMQKGILTNYIELILNYCSRFYSRQFASRRAMASDILSRFEQVLVDYYKKEKQYHDGLPSVAYCAAQLNLSANYFSDTVRRETGHSPMTHIHQSIIRRAKNMLVAGERPSGIAYELGFEYPQHFTRLFKKIEGCTPTQFLRNNR